MKKERYVAIDLETTGLNPRTDRILELGAVLVEDGKPQKTYSTFLNIGTEVPEFITGLTGITSQMAASGLPTRQGLAQFLDFCGECDILGHNILFDYSFLKQNLSIFGIPFERKGIDTLAIARKYLSGLPGRSLENLCLHYGIDQDRKHRACEDAWAAARLYECMAGEFLDLGPEDFEPKQLCYQVKKESPITKSQKVYLIDLAKYHKIDLNVAVETLTKSQASRMIDRIIAEHGRIRRQCNGSGTQQLQGNFNRRQSKR